MALNIILIIVALILVMVVFLIFKIDKIYTISDVKTQTIQNIADSVQKHHLDSQERFSKWESTLTTQLNNKFQELQELLNIKMENFGNRLTEWQRKTTEAFSVNFDRNRTTLDNNFDKVRKTLDDKLTRINENVDANINKNFEETTKTFQNVLKQLIKIDEAQKNLEGLSKNIVSLQTIFSSNQARGSLGEVQLRQVLSSIFGDSHNNKFYALQSTISDNSTKKLRPDAIIFFPKPTGSVCVDSKFPLSNYQKMLESIKNSDTASEKEYKKQFAKDVKDRISEVAQYVSMKEVADIAILFIPAEAVFAFIHSYYPELIEFAQRQKVFIASPTTLMALCNTLHAMVMQIELSKNVEIIRGHLGKLSTEFNRYEKRWNDLENSLQVVSKRTTDVGITSRKIIEEFNRIRSMQSIPDNGTSSPSLSTKPDQIIASNNLEKSSSLFANEEEG